MMVLLELKQATKIFENLPLGSCTEHCVMQHLKHYKVISYTAVLQTEKPNFYNY